MKRPAHFKRAIIGVGVVTVLILMIPLIAMQFTTEVKWSFMDFIVMGALIFVTGISFMWVTRSSSDITYRVAAALAFGSGFLMIWANLAVGLIGSGPNTGNLMYAGIIVVGAVGTILSRLKPEGMTKTMYAVVLALALHTTISLLTGIHEYAGTSSTEIIGINGFFASLFLVAALLFHYAGHKPSRAVEHSGA